MSVPTRLGKYDIKSVLGKGAMGIVYQGYDPHIQRTVAIKTVRKDLMDKELTDQFLARFKNEARAAGRLHHPNIVGIYEYGEEENVAFIAMEYVNGVGLREYLERKVNFEFGQLRQRHGPAPASAGIRARARRRASRHQARQPHHHGERRSSRSPISALRASTRPNSRWTARCWARRSYMSPEQCTGRPSDHRSDLFSAAVVFYELLTGEKPFHGNVEALTHQICQVEARPPSQVAMLPLPPAIDCVVREGAR